MSLIDTITEVVENVVERLFGQRVLGVVYARVIGIEEEGIVVEYLSQNLDLPSDTAPVVCPFAGDKRGGFFRPEVDDVVIVAFENGDVSEPVILGGVWREGPQPPTQADLSAANNKRTLVSREGHEVTFDDTPGVSQILIRTKSGAKIVLDEGGKQIRVDTSGRIADSAIVLDGVAWNHQHATGTGPSGPPVSISPPPPAVGSN